MYIGNIGSHHSRVSATVEIILLIVVVAAAVVAAAAAVVVAVVIEVVLVETDCVRDKIMW